MPTPDDIDTLREQLSRAIPAAQAMGASEGIVSGLVRALAELRVLRDPPQAAADARMALRTWRSWAFGSTGGTSRG